MGHVKRSAGTDIGKEDTFYEHGVDLDIGKEPTRYVRKAPTPPVAPDAAARCVLAWEEGSGACSAVVLGSDAFTLGRHPDKNAIYVLFRPHELPENEAKSRSVSTTHCRLERHGQTWRLCDLGSTNGTTLGGQALKPRVWTPMASGVPFFMGPNVGFDLVELGTTSVLKQLGYLEGRRSYVIGAQEFTVGSGAADAVRVRGPGVEVGHARVQFVNGAARLAAARSAVLVGGRPLRPGESAALVPWTTFSLGGVMVRVEERM